jgi:predicted enzyme related to lactoylglutathione lyase
MLGVRTTCVSREELMGQPVVHVEVIGTDPTALRSYYGSLFGWEFDTSGEVAREVSTPDDYGFTDGNVTDEGLGIPGGVGGGPSYRPRALFYVSVPDVEEALRRAESLGGARVLDPARAPSGLVVGQFTDPEGNLIGVAALPAAVD